jgi:hypothetical protein
MKTKVHGGTVGHCERSLCGTCSHSTIIRGRTLDEEIVECNASSFQGRTIPFKVTSCTSYIDARLPAYHEMVKMAWILMPFEKKRQGAGFIRASELDPAELAQVLMSRDGPDDAE